MFRVVQLCYLILDHWFSCSIFISQPPVFFIILKVDINWCIHSCPIQPICNIFSINSLCQENPLNAANHKVSAYYLKCGIWQSKWGSGRKKEGAQRKGDWHGWGLPQHWLLLLNSTPKWALQAVNTVATQLAYFLRCDTILGTEYALTCILVLLTFDFLVIHMFVYNEACKCVFHHWLFIFCPVHHL